VKIRFIPIHPGATSFIPMLPGAARNQTR